MNIDTPKTNAFLMHGDEFRDRDELIDLARDFERDVHRSNAEITRLREQVRVLREALADAHVFMQIMMEEHGDHGVRLLIKDTEAALEATKP